MKRQTEELIRWLYVIAGFSRAKLAKDFECSIAEVDEVVSRDLARIVNPQAIPEGQPKQIIEIGAPLRQEAAKPDYEMFRRAAAKILAG